VGGWPGGGGASALAAATTPLPAASVTAHAFLISLSFSDVVTVVDVSSSVVSPSRTCASALSPRGTFSSDSDGGGGASGGGGGAAPHRHPGPTVAVARDASSCAPGNVAAQRRVNSSRVVAVMMPTEASPAAVSGVVDS